MPNYKTLSSLVATILALAFLAPQAAAQSVGCRHTNKVGSGTSIGSQVDGELVTICVNKKLAAKLKFKTPAKPAPKVPSKPTIKPGPKPSPKKPVIKWVPKKPTVHTRVVHKKSGSKGVFKPRITQPRVAPMQTKVGVPVTISSAQQSALGNATLAGSAVVVRLTPVKLNWNFGDGQTASALGASARYVHRYGANGSYLVQLHVEYRVEYRLASGYWYRDPDQITLAAKPVKVQVGAAAIPPLSQLVLVTP